MTGFDFLPGTAELVSTAEDATLVRWDAVGSGQTLRTFGGPARAVFALSASRMAVVEERLVHVYDVASGWEVASAVLSEPWRGGAVAPGRALLAAGGASTLDIVDLDTGGRRSFPVPKREDAVAFSPDGSVVATLREEPEPLAGRPLILRDSVIGRELSTSAPLKGGAFHFRCRSPDGSHFGFNGTLWRLGSDPKRRLETLGWPGRPRQCAVSPDGRYVATAAER